MRRIGHQLFYACLMLAMAAVYSALASIHILCGMYWRYRRGH